MFECVCNNRKKTRKEIDDNESCSNDDKVYNARRSKRQKYLSLKAFEHFENDKSITAKRSRYEDLKEVIFLLYK